MINLAEIENLVEITSENKIKELIIYLKGKNPSELKPLFIQEDLNLDRLQIDCLKKILAEITDCNLLSVTIESALLNHIQKNDEISRLVMTGDFQHKDVDYTDNIIHQMIERADRKITIIGYFVWGMAEFFEKWQILLKNVKTLFVLHPPKVVFLNSSR